MFVFIRNIEFYQKYWRKAYVRNNYKKIRTGFYTNLCKKTAKQYGKGLHINHWSKFTSKTYIGDNCHFNGMKITGNGTVTIGNNFHSGGAY